MKKKILKILGNTEKNLEIIKYYNKLKKTKPKINEYSNNIILTAIKNYKEHINLKDNKLELINSIKINGIIFNIYFNKNYYVWIPEIEENNNLEIYKSFIDLGFYKGILIDNKDEFTNNNNFCLKISNLFKEFKMDNNYIPTFIENHIKNKKINKENYYIYEILINLIKYIFIAKKSYKDKDLLSLKNKINKISLGLTKNNNFISYGTLIFGLQNKFKNKLCGLELLKIPPIRIHQIYIKFIFKNDELKKEYTNIFIEKLNNIVKKCSKYSLTYEEFFFTTLIYSRIYEEKNIEYITGCNYSSVFRLKFSKKIFDLCKNIKKENIYIIKEHWFNLILRINPKRLYYLPDIIKILNKELKIEIININYKLYDKLIDSYIERNKLNIIKNNQTNLFSIF